ncbi:unnamed protein product [Bursaphelenchus xylophilus]|uniref:(pine wood nematode) hypothetical protein n=1 Tax=Bursaphelenchus xylophilus TaxID=6326 RepID=A0A1I7S885_BURXY|nr:unnamed protein product [Bursaphelenchus xylophilus]CAG9080437.1 unnamed protein product [Bursaphelenchus xylophilus]
MESSEPNREVHPMPAGYNMESNQDSHQTPGSIHDSNRLIEQELGPLNPTNPNIRAMTVPSTKRHFKTKLILEHPADKTRCYVLTNGGQWKRNQQTIVRYVCASCRSLKDGRIIVDSLQGCARNMTTGVWEGNPHELRHYCEPRLLDVEMGRSKRNELLNTICEKELLNTIGECGPETDQSASNKVTLTLQQYAGNEAMNGSNEDISQQQKRMTKAISRSLSSRYPKISSVEELVESDDVKTKEFSSITNSEGINEPWIRTPQPNFFLLTTETHLKALAGSTEIFIAGTYDFCPTGYLQLLSIFGNVESDVLPMFLAPMKKKSYSVYRKLFIALKSLLQEAGLTIEWRTAHFPYETASVKAFAMVFPSVQPVLCVFLLKQALLEELGKSRFKRLKTEHFPIVEKVCRTLGGLQHTKRRQYESLKAVILEYVQRKENRYSRKIIRQLKQLVLSFFATYVDGPLGKKFFTQYRSETTPISKFIEDFHSSLAAFFRRKRPPLAQFLFHMRIFVADTNHQISALPDKQKFASEKTQQEADDKLNQLKQRFQQEWSCDEQLSALRTLRRIGRYLGY